MSGVPEPAPAPILAAPAPWVLHLADPAARDPALAGGKGAGLARLVEAGLPVPEGVVVTAPACAALLAGAGQAGATAELSRRAREPAAPGEEAWLAAVRAAIAAAPLPPGLARALAEALASPAGPGRGAPLAVRSSGTVEDGAEASFAGQFESRLHVRGEAALQVALRACFASLFTPRVAAYLRAQGDRLPAEAPGLAVVVQRLVQAEAAGALFTVNPLTGREEETVIEAVAGPGEGHASGRRTGDRFVVDALAGRLLAVERAPGGPATLDEAQALALAELGARAQEHLGRPLDLEWVRDGAALLLVQARPITRIHFAPDLGEWTTADFRDGGVSSGPCAPLLASLYERAFEHSMPAYLGGLGLVPPGRRDRWYRVFFARPYWNVAAAKAAVGRLPGFVERSFDQDLGIEPAYDGPGRRTPATVRTVLGALPVLGRLRLGYRRRLSANARLLAAFPARAAPFELDPPALAALSPEAFAAGLRALLEDLHFETETAYFGTIYDTSNAKLEFSGPFARARRRTRLDYGRLVGGLGDLSHLRPLADLHATLARLRAEGRAVTAADAEAFALRWPWHGRRELDLTVPRWPDDLGYVRDMMARALAAWRPEDDPALTAAAQRRAHERELRRALAALRGPFARASFRGRLARLRRFTLEREELRDRSTRVYALVRRWALEAGRRLAAAGALPVPDAVFALGVGELLDAAHGRVPAAETARRARAGERLLRSYRNFANPDELGARREHAPAPPPAPGPLLSGTACSPGRGAGRARVVRALEDASRLAPGDVLVAPYTDTGWTPLFPGLAAVVTETGGLLSHAAVIAREYGIPAVLSVPGATRRIPDGAPVEVDGAEGTVRLVEAPP
jgi:phosphohistidine swiveling domain-containing protein